VSPLLCPGHTQLTWAPEIPPGYNFFLLVGGSSPSARGSRPGVPDRPSEPGVSSAARVRFCAPPHAAPLGSAPSNGRGRRFLRRRRTRKTALTRGSRRTAFFALFPQKRKERRETPELFGDAGVRPVGRAARCVSPKELRRRAPGLRFAFPGRNCSQTLRSGGAHAAEALLKAERTPQSFRDSPQAPDLRAPPQGANCASR